MKKTNLTKNWDRFLNYNDVISLPLADYTLTKEQ